MANNDRYGTGRRDVGSPHVQRPSQTVGPSRLSLARTAERPCRYGMALSYRVSARCQAANGKIVLSPEGPGWGHSLRTGSGGYRLPNLPLALYQSEPRDVAGTPIPPTP